MCKVQVASKCICDDVVTCENLLRKNLTLELEQIQINVFYMRPFGIIYPKICFHTLYINSGK